MPNQINISIDVTLIDKARLVPGKKLNKKGLIPQYLKITLIPSKQNNFGDWRDKQTHMVTQSTTKIEREDNVKLPILGNAIEELPEFPTEEPSSKPAIISDEDVPF